MSRRLLYLLTDAIDDAVSSIDIANDTGECFPDFTDIRRLHIHKVLGRTGVGPAFFAWLGYAGTIARATPGLRYIR